MRINTIDQLEEVSAILHDARLLKSDINYQPEKGTFSLTCWAVSTTTSDSWRAFNLSFFNVEDAKVHASEEVPYYEIATIKIALERHRIYLVTHYAMHIVLRVGEFRAELAETGRERPRWD